MFSQSFTHCFLLPNKNILQYITITIHTSTRYNSNFSLITQNAESSMNKNLYVEKMISVDTEKRNRVLIERSGNLLGCFTVAWSDDS